MMKKRTKFYWLVLIVVCGLFAVFSGISAAAETQPSVSAEFVGTDLSTGPDWESRYGYAGYVVTAANELNKQYPTIYRNFYSDMYKEKGNDGRDPLFPETAQEAVHADGTVYYDYETRDYGLDSTAVISKWGVTAAQWGNSSVESNNSAPYIPDSQENTCSNVSYGGGGDRRGTSVFFTLTTEEEIYVTVYIYDFVTNGVEVDIFNSEISVNGKTVSKSNLGTPLTEMVTVVPTDNVAYVTYKLKGAGKYQIAASRVQGSNGQPAILAFFFDKSRTVSAEHVRTDYAQANDWQSAYGKNGYVVLAGDSENSQYPSLKRDFYSDLYTDTGNDGTLPISAQTEQELVSRNGVIYYDYSSRTYGLDDSAPIKKWGITASMWQTQEGGNVLAPYIPGTQQDSQLQLVGGYGERKGTTLFFTLRSDSAVYVTLYVYNSWTSAYDQAIRIDLFNSMTEIENQTGDMGVFGDPICDTVSVTPDPQTGIVYVTYRLQGAGRYQFVTSRGDGNENGNPTIAAFFFDEEMPALQREAIEIDYQLDGGLNNPANPARIFSGTAIRLSDASKEYSDFEGWYKDPDFLEEADEIRYDALEGGSVKVYARFVSWQKHSIVYVLDGGVNAAENPSEFYEKVGVGTLYDASKEHHIFEGWYADENFNEKVSGIPADTAADVRLYAKFTMLNRAQIFYELNGGTNSLQNPDYIYQTEEAITLAPAEKSGANFIGWFYDENFEQEAISIIFTSEEPVHLYAKFEEIPQVYKVSYLLDGGNNSASNPEEYTAGKSYTLYPAEKEGYTFTGWYSDEALTQKVTEISSEDTGDLVLYAAFEKIVVRSKIIYFLDGGTQPESNPDYYTEGEEVTLQDAEKEGYIFEGWYRDSSFTQKITKITKEDKGDLELYAKFTEVVSPESGCGGCLSKGGNIILFAVVSVAACLAVYGFRKHERKDGKG